jgi:hypothetical protein
MIQITSDGKLDLGKLTKGDFITEDVLRKVTGFDPRENPETYSFAVLRIRQTLEHEYNLICRGQGYALRILTTNEATYYAATQARRHRRGQRRNLGRLIKLDEQEMDEITRVQHRKHVDSETKFDSAQQQAWKQIRVSQTQERLSQLHQDKPITIVSTKKGTRHGTSTSEHTTHGDTTATSTQRPDGQSAASASEADEAIDQQAK